MSAAGVLIMSRARAQAWETALNQAHTPATRKIALRMSMVFTPQNGTVFRVLRRLARCGLGGKMGSGRQFVSWIHYQDFIGAIRWLIDHEVVRKMIDDRYPG